MPAVKLLRLQPTWDRSPVDYHEPAGDWPDVL